MASFSKRRSAHLPACGLLPSPRPACVIVLSTSSSPPAPPHGLLPNPDVVLFHVGHFALQSVTFSHARATHAPTACFMNDTRRLQACEAAVSAEKQRGERVSAQLRASNDGLRRTKQVGRASRPSSMTPVVVWEGEVN